MLSNNDLTVFAAWDLVEQRKDHESISDFFLSDLEPGLYLVFVKDVQDFGTMHQAFTWKLEPVSRYEMIHGGYCGTIKRGEVWAHLFTDAYGATPETRFLPATVSVKRLPPRDDDDAEKPATPHPRVMEPA